ncbi:MAG: TonB family protein [bacterium]
MSTRAGFAQNLTVVTFAHGAIIACLVIVAAMPVYRKKMPDFMAVSLADSSPRNDDPPAPVAQHVESVVPPAPLVEEQVVTPPELVEKVPTAPIQDPAPVIIKPVQVVKPRQAVVKPVNPTPQKHRISSVKPRPRVSAADMAKALSSGIPSRSGHSQGTGHRGGGQVSADEDAISKGLIYQAFHDAWLQPSYADAGGSVVTVSVQLLGNGLVTRPVLVKSSGNEVMDASVMQAVRSVGHINGLSAEFVRRHSDIEFRFKVEPEGTRQ